MTLRSACALISLVCFFQCGPAFAGRLLGDYVVRQWTQDSGLPSSHIEDLEAGPDGFLWLACGNTLYRFDGATADPLMRLPSNGPVIASFVPLSPAQAYASTLTDVYLCDRTNPPGNTHLLNVPLGANLDFARMPGGEVWGFTQEGVIRYAGSRTEPFPAPDTSSHSPSTRFHGGCVDSAGNLWLVSQNRIFRRSAKTGRYEQVPAPDNPEPNTGGFERIFSGVDGKVWLYLHPCHLFVFTPPQGWRKIESGFTPEQRLGIRTLHETASGEVWFGTENAIYRLKDGHRSDLTAADLGTPLYPSAILPSPSGGVWIALRGAGLIHLRPRAVAMVRAAGQPDPQAFYALSLQPDGTLLAGLAGHGLLSGPLDALRLGPQSPLLQNASVAAILRTPGDMTWFATLGHYLICRKGVDESIVSIESAAPLPTWNVTSLTQTPDGSLWAGSPSGLFFVQNGQPPILRVVTKEPCELALATRDGTLFAANGPRLLVVDPRAKKATPLAEVPEAVAIRVLREGRAGRLWLGTARGLYAYDRDARRLAPAPAEWHQPDRCIQQLLETRDGRLWLGTRTGILRLGESPSDAARLYDHADGMESTECTGGFAPAGLALPDGRLLFPTLNGIACIDPERLSHATSPDVRPVITESPVSFPAGTRSTTFRFSALPVSEGQHARFSWRLDDEPWSEPSSTRSATFGRLTPGPHRLAVRAVNREGVCLPPAVHAFTVRPRAWQSPLFRFAASLLSLALSGAAAAAVTRHRAQRKIRRLAQERALDRERARIARDLHDDIGAGLTRMAMLSTQGRYIPGMPEAGNELNARIFDSARETSRALNEIVWAANPDKDDSEHVVTYIALYAENFLRDAGLRARVLIAPDIPTFRIPPSVRHPLFRAVKEALTNAAKHAKAATVTLSIRFRDERLVAEVADDGQGFSVSDAHAGHGLASMQARLDEIGGLLSIDSAPGRGTRVTFTLPLRPSDRRSGGPVSSAPTAPFETSGLNPKP